MVMKKIDVSIIQINSSRQANDDVIDDVSKCLLGIFFLKIPFKYIDLIINPFDREKEWFHSHKRVQTL